MKPQFRSSMQPIQHMELDHIEIVFLDVKSIDAIPGIGHWAVLMQNRESLSQHFLAGFVCQSYTKWTPCTIFSDNAWKQSRDAIDSLWRFLVGLRMLEHNYQWQCSTLPNGLQQSVQTNRLIMPVKNDAVALFWKKKLQSKVRGKEWLFIKIKTNAHLFRMQFSLCHTSTDWHHNPVEPGESRVLGKEV